MRRLRNFTVLGAVNLVDDSGMTKGFSLIELLVVLVLVSVFSAFVGVNVAGSLSNVELKTAAKKVAAALRYARSRAVTESIPYAAIVDLNKNRVTIGPDQDFAAGEESADETSKLKKSLTLPEDVRFTHALSYDGSESDSRFFAVIFMPNGCSSGGMIFLGNDGKRGFIIKIDFITGTVRVASS